MTNPTSNYGFVLPTATDLVTDLPADFDVALQGVDTRLKALQPGTTLGDIAYSSATANTNTRLGIGTNGQVLGVSAGVPAWVTSADQTPLTTKGDLFTFTTVDARLGVGTNGQVLKANSAAATGLEWGTASATKSFALLGSSALSSTITTISSLSGYDDFLVMIQGAQLTAGNGDLRWRFNGNTGSVYNQAGSDFVGAAAYAPSNSGSTGRFASPAMDVGKANSTTGGAVNASLTISGGNSAGIKVMAGNSGNIDGGGDGSNNRNWQGFYNDTAVISSISILTLSSTFSGGTIYVYGAV
jgi:hypothetical protein